MIRTSFFWKFFRDWKFILFLVAIAGAIVLRVWNFGDWMLFKADTVRDAMVSERVLSDGWRGLPFFGPRAGGTDLRLGPAFYYFQSASVFFFGSSAPGVLAFPVLFFSLLSIPLFFLFARRLFDRDWSLVLTAVFSYGFLGIEYARFAWNPNPLPFFSLLFLYAFLRILSDDTPKKMWWFVILGIAYGVVSQLHFTSLIALPLFSVMFVAFRWKRFLSVISWRGVALFCGTVFFLYIPVFVGDTINGGKNIRSLFASIESKESKQTLIENVIDVAGNFGEHFFRISFGFLGGSKSIEYVGLALLVAGLLLSGILYRASRDESRKDILLMLLLWVMAFFILYIPLATVANKPRFFLPMLFVPVLFFGMISLIPRPKKVKIVFVIVSLAFLGVSFITNAFYSTIWLSEIHASTERYISPKRDTVVLQMKKDDMWWTWGQIRGASEFMMKDCPYENILIEYQGQASEFMHDFLYAFHVAGDSRIRRSLKYNGPSFCRYKITKAKPSGNEKDDRWDEGDLRVLVSEKRGGSFEVSERDTDTLKDEKPSKRYERWGDLHRAFNK